MPEMKKSTAITNVLLFNIPMALAVSAASAMSLLTGDFEPGDYENLLRDVHVSGCRAGA